MSLKASYTCVDSIVPAPTEEFSVPAILLLLALQWTLQKS